MRREPFYTVMFALSLKENPLHQSQECRKPSTEFTSSSVRRASSDDHQTAMQVPELALCREYPAQRLLHELGLQDIPFLKETAIKYQSYFSALEFVE